MGLYRVSQHCDWKHMVLLLRELLTYLEAEFLIGMIKNDSITHDNVLLSPTNSCRGLGQLSH